MLPNMAQKFPILAMMNPMAETMNRIQPNRLIWRVLMRGFLSGSGVMGHVCGHLNLPVPAWGHWFCIFRKISDNTLYSIENPWLRV